MLNAELSQAQGVFYKGTTLLHYNEFVHEKFGDAGTARLLQRLSPGPRKLFASAMAFEWCPLADVTAVQRAIVDEFFGGDPRQAQQAGRFDAEHQISRIYRFLLNRLEPEALIKRTSSILGQSFKGVSVEERQLGPRHWTLSLSGYVPPDEVHCYDWTGTLQGSFGACRCKNLVIAHDQCRLRGAAACVYDVSWQT